LTQQSRVTLGESTWQQPLLPESLPDCSRTEARLDSHPACCRSSLAGRLVLLGRSGARDLVRSFVRSPGRVGRNRLASNLHNLAAVLCTRGALDEAERLYRRALTIKEKLLGAESPDAGLTRNNLGALLNRIGRPGEAAAMLQIAVEILHDRLAPDHPDLILARANLERVLFSLRGLEAEIRSVV
jgi:tetratricopeptide (TPR) repeat protein